MTAEDEIFEETCAEITGFVIVAFNRADWGSELCWFSFLRV